MNLRFLGSICFLAATLLGCAGDDSSFEESEEMTDEEINDPIDPPKSTDQEPNHVPKSESNDKGFGPCPVDTYLILEKDGVKYTMKIQVFCDPIQNIINLGCPAPY